MSKQRIINHFNESAELKIQLASELAQAIEQATELMFVALSNGNRILACGNGASAAFSQHFSAQLVGRFERERLPLPAMALSTDTSIVTAVGNDYGFGDIFAKQVQAYGQAGDVLFALTTSGVSANVMCGQEGFFGTSAFQVVLDIEEMQKLDAASEYKEVNEEEEIEKMFGVYDTSEDACSINKLAIQNNVISIKQEDMGGDNDYNPGF